jgi:hypothetical protein
MEHGSATVVFKEYRPLLRKARWLLRQQGDVMLLADRGFANHALMGWLQASRWHYCFRLPCDVLLQGASKYPRRVGELYPPLGEARLYRQVRLWADQVYCCNLVLATVQGAKESWVVVTMSLPPCKPCGNMHSGFGSKNCFWIASQGRLS